MMGISFTVVTFWYTFTLFGAIDIILQLLLFVATFAISLLRFLARRIVEYHKGGLAAISLTATVVLGLVDLWFHLQGRG